MECKQGLLDVDACALCIGVGSSQGRSGKMKVRLLSYDPQTRTYTHVGMTIPTQLLWPGHGDRPEPSARAQGLCTMWITWYEWSGPHKMHRR